MFRYSLRTLLILTILGPPALAWASWLYSNVPPAHVAIAIYALWEIACTR